MEVMYLCPVCLHCEFGSGEEKIECSFCGAEMKSSGVSKLIDVDKFKEYLKSQPEFNQVLCDVRIRQFTNELAQQAKEREQQKREEAKMVHCPACGSTQIQMVPRKWSLLAGFATNKVDRVCMKCKKKF